MPESRDGEILCIGCGAMNPPGAEACAGCGHRFAGPSPGPAPRAEFAGPPAPRVATPYFGDYEPPKSRPARLPSFRIGPAMGLIAVVAVGLAAFAADASLGCLALLGLVPATIRTALVASGRDAEGRPMALGEMSLSFAATFGSAYLIVASMVIAFGITCFPIAMAWGNPRPTPGIQLGLGLGLGLVAAVAAGIGLTRALRRVARERADRERIRWRGTADVAPSRGPIQGGDPR